MEYAIFYLFAAIGAFAGYKKGGASAGYTFVSAGIASYFSVWFLPYSLLVLDHVPGDYAVYVLLGVLLLSFIILFAAVRCGIEKFLDKYPSLDSDNVLSGMPILNNAAGVFFGAASGWCIAAFFAFFITFVPADLPLVSGKEFAQIADGKLISCSSIVSGKGEWINKQQDYVKQLAGKYRFCELKAAQEKAAQEAEKNKAAAEEKEKSAASPSVENNVPAPQAVSPAAQRFASPAMQAAAQNQARALQELDDAPKAAVKKAENPDTAPAGRFTALEAEKNKKLEDGVTFSLMLPVLNADGSKTAFTKIVKMGIRLPDDGVVPRLIDVEAPHSVLNQRGKVIYRTVRVDMTNVTYASVRSLKSHLEVKYVIVKDK